MQIVNAFCEKPVAHRIVHRHISRTGEVHPEEELILSEHHVCISVDGSMELRLACIPQFLVELTLGHLMTRGLISSAAAVSKMTVSEDGEKICVCLENTSEKRALSSVAPAVWRTDWVFALADRFAEGMPLHRQTFATHSCFLAREGEILFECEDIGRHNALDKVVGYALRTGIDLKECLLYSSGRVPVDMVKKAILAGIPVFAGKGSPTAEAVELARQHGLTLVCAARGDRMKQFSGAAPQE